MAEQARLATDGSLMKHLRSSTSEFFAATSAAFLMASSLSVGKAEDA
jgi:hypothetical protein